MERQLGEISDFLLGLHGDARALEPDAFQRAILERLRTLVPFDFAAWGGAEAEERQVNEVLVLDQDQRILTEWPEVGPLDRFCDLTLEGLNRTWHFDDIPGYRDTLAYNEHWRGFEVSHMMSTIMHEPLEGYVSFMGLFHEDMARPFTEEERALKQLLMPHLAEALRTNREWTVAAAGEPAEGTALVDGTGRILASRDPFRALLREEWGTHHPLRLPEVLAGARAGGPAWRGRCIQIRIRRFHHNFLLRVRPLSPLDALPPRAREVAELFGAGLSHKEVARRLGLSPATVRKQLTNIYERLGISSKAALGRLIRPDAD
ncbi:helix-turn-helix transcriptional regulator [Thiohalorhabdus methylotrophus]|uniref:LuxR C-terminal-related transcriptional regulator n=1 Tax=Thiohalorhabdus methylotrophus TaxID=3242694 RepID=A0ABV4TXW9_9GAMM